MKPQDNCIDYIEFQARDLEKIKEFYINCFDWTFTDYGPEYTSFEDGRLAGGFRKTETEICNGVLVVLYHADLEGSKSRVEDAGGSITKDVFSFPGGRRFHFRDPSGNELAVWSDH